MMKYTYPTESEVKYAMKCGWSKEDAERGFTIVDYDGSGVLEIEAIYDAHCDSMDNYDDELAAREAERVGFCKIIPVDELPNPFYIGDSDVRWFGWVDTPENRKAIENFVKEGE